MVLGFEFLVFGFFALDILMNPLYHKMSMQLPKLYRQLFIGLLVYWFIGLLVIVSPTHAQTPTPTSTPTPTPVPFLFGSDSSGFFIKQQGTVKLRIDSDGNLDAPIKGFAPGGGGNLVPNNGFENATGGTAGETTGITNNWQKNYYFQTCPTCTYGVTTNYFRGGSRSYWLKTETGSNPASIASADFTVVPGTILKGSIDMKCSADITSGITAAVLFFTGNSSTLGYAARSGTTKYITNNTQAVGCTASTNWTNSYYEFTVPADCSATGAGDTTIDTNSTGVLDCTRARVLIMRDNTDPSSILYVDNVGIAPPSSSATLTAANVSAGSFGANTGGGNYMFPTNVGIGTASPATRLDIVGTSQIANISGNLSIVPAANLIVTQGNVGIGTASPGRKLTVSGASNAEISIATTGSGNSALYMYDTTDGGWAAFSQDGIFRLAELNASGNWTENDIAIDRSGNVGIGTASPVGKLDVVKNTATSWTATENDWALRITDGTADVGLMLGVANELNTAAIQTIDPGTAWETRPLLLNPNGGNVGIGTVSASSAKLEVAGEIRQTACPANTTKVYDNLCIDSSNRSTAFGNVGLLTCVQAGGHMCRYDEWIAACVSGISLTTDSWINERVGDDSMMVANQTSCASPYNMDGAGQNPTNVSKVYRCCFGISR